MRLMIAHRRLPLLGALAIVACGGAQHDGSTAPSREVPPEPVVANEQPAPEGPAPAPDPVGDDSPATELSGRLTVAPSVQVAAGACVFVIARSIDGNGAVTGPPLAVDRLDPSFPQPFRLTEQHMVVAGTDFTGSVELTAWLDRDCEVATRDPADPRATIRTEIPSRDVTLELAVP